MKAISTLTRLAAGSAIVATTAFAGAGFAQADGYSPERRVTYERPSDWSGFYFGLDTGYATGNFKDTFNGTAGGTSYSVNPGTPIVSGHIGFQHQFGNLVVGIEGGYAFSFTGDRGDYTDCPNVALRCAARFDNVLTVGPRVGWAMGHWMPYLTGGYANGRFTGSVLNKALTPALQEEASERQGGWYLGGGVEWNVAKNFYLGVEYRHYDFDDRNVNWRNLPSGTVNAVDSPSRWDTSLDTLTARVSWKFGREYVAPLK